MWKLPERSKINIFEEIIFKSPQPPFTEGGRGGLVDKMNDGVEGKP
jgi:hypothetical protein